jgi:REP element-mobilizing transposase RayT
MGRQPRVEIAGGTYHVTIRSNNGEHVFRDPHDFGAAVRLLGRTVKQCAWLCDAYCFLGTHYHLLLTTPEPNLSVGMRHFNGSYAQRFNLRYDRSGHVFQGPYRAGLVEGDAHLLETIRYIALNPVHAGLCDDPADWAWSSFRASSGAEAAPPWLAETYAGLLGDDPERARRLYADFVRLGTRSRDMAGAAAAWDLVPS